MNVAAFIAANLRLEPVPALPAIRLYTAHPGSRLSRLDAPDEAAPYWAYQWAGGLALALHIAAHPHVVAGRRILDLGAGSGLVAIAAAQAGAIVSAAELDPNGRVAITLNAAANGVAVDVIQCDVDGPPPAGIDLILAGDVFYNGDVAARMLPFLQRCRNAGLDVLVGDPDRRDLPLDALERVASYQVGDVGDARTRAERVGWVYQLKQTPT